MNNSKIIKLIKEAEVSLKKFTDKKFNESNAYLLNKYTEEEIIEIFKLCLILPSGKSWSPINQVLIILFQASFSKSIETDFNIFTKCGNYIIHKIPKKSKPIIYSFGIGTDISFDLASIKKFRVPIFMYDPTPKVSEYMSKFSNNKLLIFTNEGIFTKEKTIKFYLSNIKNKVNSSIYPIHGKEGPYRYVKCRTLSDFMKINNHDHIDILKMDIEGAAVDVLEDMLKNTNIRPSQIVTEIEVINIENPLSYMPRVIDLMQKMKSNNYEIYNQKLTRKVSLELIFVQKNLINKKFTISNNIIFKYLYLFKNDLKTLFQKYLRTILTDLKIAKGQKFK